MFGKVRRLSAAVLVVRPVSGNWRRWIYEIKYAGCEVESVMWVVTAILHVILRETGSQWSLARTGVMWSNFLVPMTS